MGGMDYKRVDCIQCENRETAARRKQLAHAAVRSARLASLLGVSEVQSHGRTFVGGGDEVPVCPGECETRIG